MILCCLVMALFTTGCSDITLTRGASLPSNAVSKGSFCTLNPEESLAYTNYLFIIDYSGSNDDTDPARARVAAALDFYNQKVGVSYIRWGSIAFSDDPRALIYETSDQEPIFTDDPALLQEGIDRMQNEPHEGRTNYSDTVDMAADAIIRDRELTGRQDNYIVFFLTDGEPNQGDTSTEGLVRRVEDLVGISPGKVFFSSVYYGGQGEPDKLQAMAAAGGGKYLEIENADTLDFADLLPPGAQKEAWILKNDAFFVYNLNSAICEKAGYIYAADSDADGLCDLDENFYGLDPVKRSTPRYNAAGVLEDTGYSDYFQLAQMQGKTTLAPCVGEERRSDLDGDLLNDCEEAALINFTPYGTEYKDREWTQANPKDPDTDNDGIIDGLDAVAFRKHFGWALDNRVDKDWDGEGISAFRQVQQHRNPLEEDSSSKSYDVRINPIGIDNGRSCFTYNQSSLPLYKLLPVNDADVHPKARRASNQNVVMVYYVQTKFKDPNGKGIFMSSFQNIYADSTYNGALGTAAGLQVNDSVFSPYETYIRIDE